MYIKSKLGSCACGKYWRKKWGTEDGPLHYVNDYLIDCFFCKLSLKGYRIDGVNGGGGVSSGLQFSLINLDVLGSPHFIIPKNHSFQAHVQGLLIN